MNKNFSIPTDESELYMNFSVADIQKRAKMRTKGGVNVLLQVLLRDYHDAKQKKVLSNQELMTNFLADLDALMLEVGKLNPEVLRNNKGIKAYASLAMDEVNKFIEAASKIANKSTKDFANIYNRFKLALWSAL